jgi:hypothetical protein
MHYSKSTNWNRIAQRRWPNAENVGGESGPFVVLAPCGTLTRTSWPDREQAERAKRLIDRFGCGGRCLPLDRETRHELVDLSSE